MLYPATFAISPIFNESLGGGDHDHRRQVGVVLHQPDNVYRRGLSHYGQGRARPPATLWAAYGDGDAPYVRKELWIGICLDTRLYAFFQTLGQIVDCAGVGCPSKYLDSLTGETSTTLPHGRTRVYGSREACNK